jgi:hypothetical protein
VIHAAFPFAVHRHHDVDIDTMPPPKIWEDITAASGAATAQTGILASG